MKLKKRIILIIDYAILTVLSAGIIVPLLWLFGNSMKSDKDIRVNMAKLLPTPGEWRPDNYIQAWKRGNIGQTIWNSLLNTLVAVVLILFVAYFASYAIARIRYKGSELVHALFVSMMMVPLAQVVMIPQFRIISGMNLVDTHLGVILLYTAAGIPFSVFLLTSFLRKIPVELDEAARIDGCGRLAIIFRILLPLSKPGIATVVIFQGMNVWNDYFTALIYLRSPETKTVTLGLKNFMGQWGLVDYNRLFAAIAIVTFPIVLLYVIFQKQFVSGLTSGSIKG